MGIGERIRDRRMQLGLTQEQLAKKLGVSKQAVCKAEKDANNMTSDRVTKYANALHCTEAYLMGWSEDGSVPDFEDAHIELIALFSKLTKEQKQTVMNLLRSFVIK